MEALALCALLLGGASAQQASTQAAVSSTITFTAVGDIRLNGPVGELIAAHGAAYPAAKVKELLDGDVVFGNLECAITQRGGKTPKKFNFRAPPRNLALIQDAGFTVVNIANNHVWDFGRDGFEDTLAALKKRRIPYIGGGKDLAEADRVTVYDLDGWKLGLIGFTSTFPQEGWAKRRKPGVNYSDFDRLAADVAAAKKKVDVLVVSFHGGTELAEQENDIQKAFAHVAVDNGADLILGHHPHVLQPVEVYKDKPILYSLGNFFFVSPSTGTNYTVIAKAEIGKDGVHRVDFTPIDTDGGQPFPAGPEGIALARAALDRKGALTQFPDRFRIVEAGKP